MINKQYLSKIINIILIFIFSCESTKVVLNQKSHGDFNEVIDLASDQFVLPIDEEFKNFKKKKNIDVVTDCTSRLNTFLYIEGKNSEKELLFANIDSNKDYDRDSDIQSITIYNIICNLGNKANYNKNLNEFYKLISDKIEKEYVTKMFQNGNYSIKLGLYLHESEAMSTLYFLKKSKLRFKNCRLNKEEIPNDYYNIFTLLKKDYESVSVKNE